MHSYIGFYTVINLDDTLDSRKIFGRTPIDDVSAEFESFQDNLLEYPQYSRPEIWHEKQVPPVLLSGHHANIEKWRREQSVIRTAKNRPDLLEKANLTEEEKKLAKSVMV